MDELRQFGPINSGFGERCKACGESFKEGDYTTIVPLGPGDDPEAQEKAREGRPYNAVAIQIHWKCATGKEPSKIIKPTEVSNGE